jgi:hypothetical protein
MALGSIPPWLEVHPSDFVRAASEGAQAGLAVARLNQAADESAKRAAEHGKEFEEAQSLRKWEQQQQMQMHADQIRAALQKSKDDLAARTMYQRSMMDARSKSEAETMRHNLATEGKTSSAPEELTTTTKDGKTFQQRGGKWYHIPDLRAPTDTMSFKVPAVEAKPAVPAQPAIPKSKVLGILIPFTGRDAVPGSPAVAGHPDYTRIKHVPIGFDPMNPTAGGTAPPVTPAAMTPGPTMPTVLSKDQWDALPPGTQYLNKEGRKFKKPDAPEATPPVSDPIPEPDAPPVDDNEEER